MLLAHGYLLLASGNDSGECKIAAARNGKRFEVCLLIEVHVELL